MIAPKQETGIFLGFVRGLHPTLLRGPLAARIIERDLRSPPHTCEPAHILELARRAVRRALSKLIRPANPVVIVPFLTGCSRRTYAAIFSFCAGVIPPMPMFGQSLL